MLADKGNKFMNDKENHIIQIKQQDKIKLNKEAEKLKLELLKSKKTYKSYNLNENISQDKDLQRINSSGTPVTTKTPIPRLRLTNRSDFESFSTSARTKSANTKMESVEIKNKIENNKTRMKLINNITSRVHNQPQFEKTKFINPMTER